MSIIAIVNTGYIIWIVVFAIVVIMAIIGYAAEHSKQKENDKNKESVSLIDMAEVEAKAGAATWSKDAKPKDDRQEIEHHVASIDDWSKIPETDVLPEVKLDVPEGKMESGVSSEPMFSSVGGVSSEVSEVNHEMLQPEVSTDTLSSILEVSSEPSSSLNGVDKSVNLGHFVSQGEVSSLETPMPEPIAPPTSVEPTTMPVIQTDTKPVLIDAEVLSEPEVLSTNSQPQVEKLVSSESTTISSEPVMSNEESSSPNVNVDNIWG